MKNPLRRYIRRPSEMRFIEGLILGTHSGGVSSRALALTVLGLNERPTDRFFLYGREARPYDLSDWRRCMGTFRAAPRHLQRRMAPYLMEWSNFVLGRDKLSTEAMTEIHDDRRAIEQVAA